MVIKVKLAAASVLALSVLAGCNSQPAGGGSSTGSSTEPVTITYWQYSYPAKVTFMQKLVDEFQKQNPNIKVVAQDFPYDQYIQKVTAATNAKNGPDVLNLYYGWLPQFVQDGILQPLPQSFMSNDEIEKYYIPMVKESKIDGKYYAVPTAVRSLALFYNKDMFKKAGLDPNSPPKTWDEMISYAQKMTVYNNGKLEQEGFAPEVAGQGYHVFEEVLLRQWGVTPFSEDNKQVLWNSSPKGLEAFQFYMDWFGKLKLGDPSFNTDYETAFKSGKAGMIFDGSQAIPSLKKDTAAEWGVTTLPTKEPGGLKSNFGSYWVHGIAKGVSGNKLEASQKFLKFLISEETQKNWLNEVGELPAAASLSNDPKLTADPIFGAFVKGLQDAHATYFVNEKDERQAIIDMTNEILLNNAPVEKTFNELVKKQQALRDDYFSQHKN
ncbi:extracellular solute-binding protein [Paenibacillus aestuarii]|uniref:Extracellular solute-binding protein n=1 Tax=Paenibacillus aestuarii TaxID=516965 RepID=A0ABW0KCK4_9BACL|nr:extracellular solute-binding protein [Paenibacillus aestuarii]